MATALVTGASSGIGRAFAERLAREGRDLVLVARDRERLAALAAELGRAHGVGVEVLAADLCDPARRAGVEARLADGPPIELLVNDAGAARFAPLVERTADELEREVALLAIAPLRLARAALPGMIERGSGAIVFVSSRAAFAANADLPAYAGSKAFVNALVAGWARALEGTGVRLHAVCPGNVRTEFFERGGLDTAALDTTGWLAPEDVVEAALAGLRAGELVSVPGERGRDALVRRLVPERALLRVAGILRRLARS